MHLHILGICGTFMGGIAALARAAGHEVTGSDRAVYPPMSDQLEALGIAVAALDDTAQFLPRPDVVVVGNVMSRGMPAIEYLLDSGLPYTSGPEWLARHVLRDRHVIAVAGTHGKTTTASLVAWLLEHAGMAPGFLIGGVPRNFAVSARLGDGECFVVEADEYDTAFFDKRAKFVHYRPRTLILNNLEYDHADIYPDIAAIQTQFHHLVRTVPGSGRLIVNAADTHLAAVLERGAWTAQERFGSAPDCDWRAELSQGQLGLLHADELLGRCDWRWPGEHNAANAAAASAAAHVAGVAASDLVPGLAAFDGVKRRAECIGVMNGVRVFDDFAHHPTAIRKTLAGMRAQLDGGRLLAVIEPRSNTMRMGVHAAELAASVAAADRCWFFEPADLDFDLRAALAPHDGVAVHDEHEALVVDVAGEARAGDTVVIMSNGGFAGVHQRLLDALHRSLRPERP